MTWQPGVYTGLAAVAALTFATVSVVGRRKSTATASAFAWLMLGGMLWATSYGIQLGFTTRAGQLLWQRATLVTSATVPPLLLVFVLRYVDEEDRLTPGVYAVFFAELLAFAALVVTNSTHHLVWASATFDARSTPPVLDLTFGVGYYAHIVYAYTVVTVALGVLFSILFRGASVYRRQTGLLLLGAVPAFLAHVAYTLALSPVAGVDLTPFVFTVTGVLYGLALFHFDLLERTPVARRRALDIVGDGLLVVDADGHIVDADAVCRQVYDLESGERRFASVTGFPGPEAADGATEAAVLDGTRHVYDVHVSELDGRGAGAGYAVVLRDVTERNAYEQRLEVANRALRHNLRNDMNVIQGYAELLEEAADTPEHARMASTIRERAETLSSLSEKLREVVNLERGQEPESSVDAAEVIDGLLAEFREEHPAVTFEFDRPVQAPVRGLTKRALSLAVRNLVENAVEHNDCADLTVTVSAERVGSRTHIRVSDDGSGIPEMERQVLESGGETSLEHSSGLGLWLTHWIVDAAGGDVSIEISDGTAVTLELPAG